MLAESEEWPLWIQSVSIERSRPSRARGLKLHEVVQRLCALGRAPRGHLERCIHLCEQQTNA